MVNEYFEYWKRNPLTPVASSQLVRDAFESLQIVCDSWINNKLALCEESIKITCVVQTIEVNANSASASTAPPWQWTAESVTHRMRITNGLSHGNAWNIDKMYRHGYKMYRGAPAAAAASAVAQLGSVPSITSEWKKNLKYYASTAPHLHAEWHRYCFTMFPFISFGFVFGCLARQSNTHFKHKPLLLHIERFDETTSYTKIKCEKNTESLLKGKQNEEDGSERANRNGVQTRAQCNQRPIQRTCENEWTKNAREKQNRTQKTQQKTH